MEIATLNGSLPLRSVFTQAKWSGPDRLGSAGRHPFGVFT
ncbi:hypothetical protein FTUN_8360 [Frigoriglobus tundricola]|uniref:Uncharacterized protein n=1 Tax=Frigoriglobus tundricola TaxID=2774151 RepID=A0A6M5Z2T4_9BACT|nr:hypothetical protein FTUN_8360 [Frigoriglobus tundricola]